MAWIDAGAADDILEEDVVRFDHGDKTYVIVRSPEGEYFCLDGLCTDEQVHLCDGMVRRDRLECPLHGGQFEYKTGIARRVPVKVNLGTYATKVEDGRLYLDL